MEVIPIGVPFQMVGTTIYALPSHAVRMFSTHATFLLSNDPNFGNSVILDVSLTDGMADIGGGFIRCSAVQGAVITLKRL